MSPENLPGIKLVHPQAVVHVQQLVLPLEVGFQVLQISFLVGVLILCYYLNHNDRVEADQEK